MDIRTYKLHCSHCDPSQFVAVPNNDVFITVNLEDDTYEFRAFCPKCTGKILNSRPLN